MIDYESYNKLINYLEKGDLEILRAYIESEKKRYYLKNAEAALFSYLRKSNYTDYIDENRILLTNKVSLYVLNSDELLPEFSRKNKKILSREHTLYLLGELEKYEKKKQQKVGKIKSVNTKEKQIFSEDESFYHFFESRNFAYSQKFLGEDTSYSICADDPVCLAESEKGKGLILGLRE